MHIRLGDIIEDCVRYKEESTRPDSRAWVRSHFAKGYSCHQPMPQLVANLLALHTRAWAAGDGRGLRSLGARSDSLAIYAAIEDPSYLKQPLLAPFNISTLSDFEPLTRHATKAPQGLTNVLLDQMVCARADHLVLNIFSTFSQMMLTRMGLDHPGEVGWTRDLSAEQKRSLNVDVEYWKDLV